MKQPEKFLSVLIGSILLVSFLYACTTPLMDESDNSQATTIDLEQAVHFSALTGKDITIQPGSYQVRPKKDSLELVPGDTTESIMIVAESTTHEEAVDRPTALSFSEAGAEDEHFLVLMLPDGKGLEAIGSYSGIRSRATSRARRVTTAQIRRQYNVRQSARTIPITKPTISSVIATPGGYQIKGTGFGSNRDMIKVIEEKRTLSGSSIQSSTSTLINVGSKPRSIVSITVLLGQQKSNTVRYDPRRSNIPANPIIPSIATKKPLPAPKKLPPNKQRILRPGGRPTGTPKVLFACAPNAEFNLTMSLTSPANNGQLALGTQLTWERTGHDLCGQGSGKEYVLGLCQETAINCNPSNGFVRNIAINEQNWSETDPGTYTVIQDDIDALEAKDIGPGDNIKWEMRYRHTGNSNFNGRVSRTLNFSGSFTSPPTQAPVLQGFQSYTFESAGTLTKSWQAVQNASQYEYHVLYKARTVRNPEFGEMLRQDGPFFTSSNTNVTHTAVVPQHTNMVVWRVRACNPLGCGPFAYHGNEVTSNQPQGQPVTFQDLAAVFHHANCVNCHRASSEPLNNSQHTSTLAAMSPAQCIGCHQDSLFSNRGPLTPQGGNTVPMHTVQWQAPPSTMKFDVTGTNLCNRIKQQMNNTVTTNDLKDHLLGDPLILWAVQGGPLNTQGVSRNGIPGWSLQQWADKVQQWEDNNFACE
ncbi:MAG: hypothetical protein WD425_21300 [Nitrospirales bacterium]